MRRQQVQILISTFGKDGLERITSQNYPETDNISYLISWQNSQGLEVPEWLRERKDMTIIRESSTGLCNNRNAALRKAQGPWVVIADDDLHYTPEQLMNLLKALKENQEADFLAFRYRNENFPKAYPEYSFEIGREPKNYFTSSVELAMNLRQLREKRFREDGEWFNPAFGINGTIFSSGEEDILIAEFLKKGFQGKYIPKYITTHSSPTTSEKAEDTREFIETKGAVMLYVKPHSWPLRMLTHAWRSSVPFGRYCRWWVDGVRKARKNKVFER